MISQWKSIYRRSFHHNRWSSANLGQSLGLAGALAFYLTTPHPCSATPHPYPYSTTPHSYFSCNLDTFDSNYMHTQRCNSTDYLRVKDCFDKTVIFTSRVPLFDYSCPQLKSTLAGRWTGVLYLSARNLTLQLPPQPSWAEITTCALHTATRGSPFSLYETLNLHTFTSLIPYL